MRTAAQSFPACVQAPCVQASLTLMACLDVKSYAHFVS